MVTKLDINDNGAFFQSRFVGSEAYEYWKETGELLNAEFGTDAPILTDLKNFVKYAMGQQDAIFSDNPSATVMLLPGREDKLLSYGETKWAAFLLNTSDLETTDRVEYGNEDEVTLPISAGHPRLLPDGTLIGCHTNPIGDPHYLITRQDSPVSDRKAIARIQSDPSVRPGWIHDFGYTQKYVLVNDSPLGLGNPRNDLNNACLFFHDESKKYSYMTLVDLKTGEQEQFKVPPRVIYHFTNCYEEDMEFEVDGENVSVPMFVVEAPMQLGMGLIRDFLLENVRRPDGEYEGCEVFRYFLPIGRDNLPANVKAAVESKFAPDTQAIIEQVLPRSKLHALEEPIVSPKVKMQKHRYTYGYGLLKPGAAAPDTLVKIDSVSGEVVASWKEQGMAASEPNFLPHPDGKDEDDGLVMAYIYGADSRQYCIMLDGKTWEEVGRVYLPSSFPACYHLTFYPNNDPFSAHSFELAAAN